MENEVSAVKNRLVGPAVLVRSLLVAAAKKVHVCSIFRNFSVACFCCRDVTPSNRAWVGVGVILN